MSLNKDEILAASDIKIEPITIPEWGGTVYVKTMTGAERDAFEKAIFHFDEKTKKNQLKIEFMRATLAALTLCDEQGKRLFEITDVEALAAKSANALQRISDLAQKLSAVTEAEMDELEKN